MSTYKYKLVYFIPFKALKIKILIVEFTVEYE